MELQKKTQNSGNFLWDFIMSPILYWENKMLFPSARVSSFIRAGGLGGEIFYLRTALSAALSGGAFVKQPKRKSATFENWEAALACTINT